MNECMTSFATPANTLGAGNIEIAPEGEIANSLPPVISKGRKRKLKSLKKYLKEKTL